MRNRLALILALAAFGLVLVAAVAGAQNGNLLQSGQSGVSVDLPGGQELAPVGGNLPACSNLSDDDADGVADLADPGCEGPLDADEVNAAATPDGTTTTTPDPEPEPDPENPDRPDLDRPDLDGDGGKGGDGETGGVKGPGGKDKPSGAGERDKLEPAAIRNPDGSPTGANPTLSVADFAPAPIGISNEVIDSFSIPPFLLPIYQACGTQYGIPWQVLASINRIETHFGQLAGVTSTAGAIGWMQFLPSTWEAYGVDANGDGRKDPYNPVDAICAAG
ncbi:MAG: lytic murein transglycosylase, partial [Solirubrobacterales bacterium]